MKTRTRFINSITRTAAQANVGIASLRRLRRSVFLARRASRYQNFATAN